MEPKIEYQVRADNTVEVINASTIELETVPCWTLTRVTSGMGWHIGKYRTPEAAHAVAAVLKAFTGDELV